MFSKTLEQVQGNATLNRGNIVEEIARLKTQPGKDMSVGGATIAATLMRSGLIDEYWLYVQPVILGSGTPMFPSLDNKINLRLIETRTFNSGVVLLRYQVSCSVCKFITTKGKTCNHNSSPNPLSQLLACCFILSR